MNTRVWVTESLRFTVFPKKAIDENLDLWSNVIGELPEMRNQNPRRGTLTEEGVFSDGKLMIETQPLRLDCKYIASTNGDVSVEGPPNTGEFEISLKSFQPVVQKLVESPNFPEVKRVAFGAIFLSPTSDRRNGYIELNEYLPFAVDANGSSDFLYQINRPRTISLLGEDVVVNRLSKWSVVLFQVVAFQIGQEAQSVTSTQPIAALRLELDINNAAESDKVYGYSDVLKLFYQLVDNAKEIIKKGDIP